MRKYLDLKFGEVQPVLSLSKCHCQLKIVCCSVFVGSDFLPNIFDLHIHENALGKLFWLYKKVLLRGLKMLLDEMTLGEQEVF